MRKRTLAITLILALCVSVVWYASPLTPTVASAKNRSGFTITPEKEDETGVALDSGFILTSLKDLTLDYVKNNVSMREGVLLNISQLSGGKYLLKPAEPLLQNKVYYIDINSVEGETVTFAFQTKRDFVVSGSLPADTSSNVPLDAGIELYFSYPDAKNIDKYFEITPRVSGRFESNGYTSVFIPDNKLEPGTIYTVTVKKGLTAANGLVTLKNDYVFQFETSLDQKSTADPYPGYLSISDNWIEFGTAEKPTISFSIYLNQNPESVDVNLTVYQFKTIDDFIKSIREKEKAPSWAPYALSKSKIETSGLKKVLEFTQNFNLSVWQSRYMMFPETLPHGYYLIEMSCDDLNAQAFLQISDVSAYTISDKDNTLFWLNDIKTGKAVNSAEIYDYTNKNSAKTDKDGLAKLSAATLKEDSQTAELLLYKVKTSSGQESLINAGYLYYSESDSVYYNTGLNWRYFQTDRSLYKPSDTVEFWGFVKSRIDGSSPSKVTVELSKGGFYYPMRMASSIIMPPMSNVLETISLDTQAGFFEGRMKLPVLDPGHYSLTVKDGDKVISSTYINVENYIKPQYKLEITSNKNAVFTGERITFEIKASFFDGTPVSNIPLRYNIYGYDSAEEGKGVTDANGILKVVYTPTYNNNMQGQCHYTLNASAEFPETGNIYEYHTFKVFANDITFDARGEINEKQGTVTVNVNKVEPDTLNDEDLTNDDYKGKPVNNHKVSVKIVQIVWERIERGTEYDAINKVVRKIYEYREKRITVSEGTTMTDREGVATFNFNADPDQEGYYVAEITAKDNKGRSLKGDVWIYNTSSTTGFKYPSVYEYYTLKTDKDSYKANETVNVEVLKNNEEPVKDLRTLFVQARNGIQGYTVENQPQLSQTFPEYFAPNYYLEGVMFNGKGYIKTRANIPYDYSEKEIKLEIYPDKDSYKPGDNMTIYVKASDINGKPVSAKVNISMVDEALLKLSGHHIEPLSELYSWIGDGIVRSIDNRRSARGGVVLDDGAISESSLQAPVPSPAPMDPSIENKSDMGVGSAGSSRVRSEFKDTALFKTVTLDENGLGSYTFKLPDNITSFSLAAAAVSTDLYAGSQVQSAKVSMPFFINDALSLDYLEGDKPFIGLTAYGEELKENQKVDFEVTVKELPEFKKKVSARAFERVNIELPALEEGTYTITMRAVSNSGREDALSRTINVYSSYRTIENSVIRKLTANMEIPAGKSGITTLIFTDAGRGSLINSLHSLAWQYGNRLDQKLTTNFARKLLKEIINNDQYNIEPIEVEPSDYRNSDGGYGILPYAETDLKFSALVTPLLKDITDTSSLKMYFYNELASNKGVQPPALFALAELGEPVLVEINKAATIENLSLEDYLFIGLAYEAIGDYTKAAEIYNNRVSPSLERKDPYIRAKVNNGNIDASYSQTALAAVLASKIDSPDAPKLYQYAENNYSKTLYTGIEKVLYLADRMTKLNDAEASFEYSLNGTVNNVDLSNGLCEVVKVPSVNIGRLNIRNVKGDVNVLSLFTAPYTDKVNNEPGITITRKYYNAATGKETTRFKANDIVRVEITYNIGRTAIDNTYEISDYAPAGLKPLFNPWNHGFRDMFSCWYRQFEGQKVTFVVGKNVIDPKPLVYYARIASPGEYTAEGTVAQGSMVKTSIATIENTKIVIEP